MATSTTTILDLNDECLLAIFERLGRAKTKRDFSRACDRFAEIYVKHYVHQLYCMGWDEHYLDTTLVVKFGHLIGTYLFPMHDIEIVKFDDKFSLFFTKRFFRMLKKNYLNIIVMELNGFADEHLEHMMPIRSLKELHLICSRVTGAYMDELRNLEVLLIDTALDFESKYLVKIAQGNKLEKLVLHNCPLVFARRHAMDMYKNLKYLCELEADWTELRRCQLLGHLPCLKVLIINNFRTFQCGMCRRHERGNAMLPIHGRYLAICNCGVYDGWVLFKNLRKRNILEQLIFPGASITTRDLIYITKLTSLRKLNLNVYNTPLYVSIAMFNNLRQLEEIELGESWKLPGEALDFLSKCQKLRYINFGNAEGFCQDFILKAIEVLKRRPEPPVEPVRMKFLNPDFGSIFLEVERVRSASSLLHIDCLKVSEMISRLQNYIYNFFEPSLIVAR